MVRLQLILIGLACGLLLSAGRVGGQPPHRSEGSRPSDHPHPSDGSRGNDPFFEAMREVHRDSSNRELFDLLRDPNVRQEIHLSEADSKQLEANGREAFEAIRAVRKANQDLATSKEELKQQIRAVLDPLEAKSFEILQKPEVDFQRLLGIYAQARGYRALLNDEVAQVIGLQGAALDDFRKFRSDNWRAIMDDTRRSIEKEIRNTPPGSSPREAISSLFRRAEEALDKKLASQLTEEQRAALEQLKGVKFDLQPQPFSFPPGRRRGHADHSDSR
ncbi:MAG: hypothetical protein R3C09_06515 [Pirellulaceae bacterium]